MKLRQIRVDGYKNLINCVVDLGDFNVLVGANNCGKSNLMEALQMLWPICFGDQDTRSKILKGMTPRLSLDTSICHLKAHKGKPLTLGVSFDVSVDDVVWAVDYDVTIKCDHDEDATDRGYQYERLQAKEIREPGKPGGHTVFIERKEKEGKNIIRVREKDKVRLIGHAISKTAPSMIAIEALYPEFQKLSREFETFVNCISEIARTSIFALSPTKIRRDIDTDKEIQGLKITTFDLCSTFELLKEETPFYELYCESLADILDLEKVSLDVKDYKIAETEAAGSESKSKKVRLFCVWQLTQFGFIEEFSDGTLMVAAILLALFLDDRRGSMLLLEEIENCLHPKAIKRLLELLQDNSDRWPVMITTHSPYLLNGVNPEDVRVAVVDETGATHFRSVENNRELRDYLNKGLMSFGDLLVNDFDRFRE